VAVAEAAMRWCVRQRGRESDGFTLIELIVVVCIVAVSATLLLNRLRYYQEAAEKAAMEQQVAALRSALQLRVAAMLVQGEERNIESLTRVNPINWLMESPPGYRGEFLAPNVDVPHGSWYFDAAAKELVYVPTLDTHLRPGAGGGKRLRFRVQLEFEPAHPDSERNRRFPTATHLVPVSPYAWF